MLSNTERFEQLRAQVEAAGLGGPPTADEQRQYVALLLLSGATPLHQKTVVDGTRRRTMHIVEMHTPFWALWDVLTDMVRGVNPLTQLITEKYGCSVDRLVGNQLEMVADLWTATSEMPPAARRTASYASCGIPMAICGSGCGCEFGQRRAS